MKMSTTPFAIAQIHGNEEFPSLNGVALFYPSSMSGIYVQVEAFNLPDKNLPNSSGFFGMHIHEFGNCNKPFDQTGAHYSTQTMNHPYHLGDLPPLLSHNGYAWSAFYDGRLSFPNILNRSLIIHSNRDDFTSQPSGDSGRKIGCGVIIQL